MNTKTVQTIDFNDQIDYERIGLQVNEPLTNLFKFELGQKQIDEMLIKLSKNQNELFSSLCKVGKQLEESVNNNNIREFIRLIDENQDAMIFHRYFIEECFLTALSLKYSDFIEFMLVNGLCLQQEKTRDCVYQLMRVSKFVNEDPPIDILMLFIRYKADINYINPNSYKTPLHQAVKYNIISFVQLLIQSGADPNVVDSKKRIPFNMIQSPSTPLQYQIINYLHSQNVHTLWNQ